MLSTTVDHIYKPRRSLFIIIVAASILLTTASFTATAYGAGLGHKQQPDIGAGIDLTVKVPVSAMKKNSQVELLVFFTRPAPCTQNHDNCVKNVKSYAPDSTISCAIPVPQSQNSSMSNSLWVSKDGKECPYLNCNWASTAQGCSSLTQKTIFRPLPSPIAGLESNVYMSQILDFKTQVKSENTVGFTGCIYYGTNYARFPTHYTQVVLSMPDRQLLSGTLPKGVTLQTIQNILSSKQAAKTKTLTWTPS
jgi:hypothetical protein